MTTKSVIVVCVGILMSTVILAYFFLTVFVIHPMGALPDGKTLIAARVGKSRFIDSADAICEREMGGVSLLCRGMVMGKFLEETTIYFSFPYSEILYFWSTDGREYGR